MVDITTFDRKMWDWCRIPGMILLPGSFSGRLSSPSPQRGPEARKRMSLAIFIRLTATVFKAPDTSTMASWAARASNLLGADLKGRPKMHKYMTVVWNNIYT